MNKPLENVTLFFLNTVAFNLQKYFIYDIDTKIVCALQNKSLKTWSMSIDRSLDCYLF